MSIQQFKSKQKIVPHLWFDKEAKEATAFYATLFPNSKVKNVTTITGTPSGDCDIVTFDLASQEFMAISAGPIFMFNPAISLFVAFDTEEEIETAWNKLIDGGKALMAYDTYPWAKKYGWLQDKYGLSWQLSMSEHHKMDQKITPMLMFTQEMAGKTKEAIEMYTGIFPNSKTEMLVPYTKEDGDEEGYIKHSRFTLAGQSFMAMDSSGDHKFTFNEALSLMVKCDTQEEIDHYWSKLSAHPEAEQCGWLKDKYGVSWQIVPTVMDEMMASGDKEKIARVTQAFLKMKRFDIKTLEEAYRGE
jgi:predicted 3-demethylubiquinone-9 3-methyltransferase (glyoxalase superfamily)